MKSIPLFTENCLAPNVNIVNLSYLIPTFLNFEPLPHKIGLKCLQFVCATNNPLFEQPTSKHVRTGKTKTPTALLTSDPREKGGCKRLRSVALPTLLLSSLQVAFNLNLLISLFLYFIKFWIKFSFSSYFLY